MQLSEILAKALEFKSLRERREFVADHCAEDASLRTRVLGILDDVDDTRSHFVDSQARDTDQGPHFSVPADGVIGRYKLIEPLGEGGFGTVYLALQTQPIRRAVALKVIKPGMDSRQIVARFEAERQALALMNHPGIARVFDGGTTPSGHPYFVMELVNGIPITNFCDENKMALRERIELFIDVCHAIQHAHQKGIIHRDLKPSNILVTRSGKEALPKVIDFGVAKAIDQQSLAENLSTHFGQIVGTPHYMSPEQAQLRTGGVDTRSDVYTLGVLLYKLLTGDLPLRAIDDNPSSFEDIRRIIVDRDPPAPSSRIRGLGNGLVGVAELRGSDPRQLLKNLRKELDWIVMKTLSKEPDQRYESASALAQDLTRYLNDEPVLAGPPTMAYRLSKLVRRHRGLSAGLAVATAALILAALFAFSALVKQRDALARQQEALSRSDTMLTLLEDLMSKSDPDLGHGPDYTVRQMLDDFSRDLEKLPELKREPLVEADLRLLLGKAYIRLGLWGRSRNHFQIALDKQKRELGVQSAPVAATLARLATNSLTFDRFPDGPNNSIDYSNQGIAVCDALNDTSEVMMTLRATKAFAQIHLGQIAEARQTLDSIKEIMAAAGTPIDESSLPLRFARYYLADHKPEIAEKLIRGAMQNPPATQLADPMGLRIALASCLMATDRFGEAEQIYRELYRRIVKPQGTYSTNEITILAGLAGTLRSQNRHVEAADVLDTNLLAMNAQAFARVFQIWIWVHLDLAEFDKIDQQCMRIAEGAAEANLQMATRVVALSMRELVAELLDPENVSDVALANRETMSMGHQRFRREMVTQLTYAWNLLRGPQDNETIAEAKAVAEDCVGMVANIAWYSPDSVRFALPRHVLARALAAEGNVEQAVELSREALGNLPPRHWFLRGRLRYWLVKHLVAAGDLDAAREVLEKAVEESRSLRGQLAFHSGIAQLRLAEFLWEHAPVANDKQKDKTRASELYQRAAPLLEDFPQLLRPLETRLGNAAAATATQ